ncbi:MAG: hypothetical protein KGJ13_06400 [Patescibacteria group bacterium]|nr:hypothetical protein [Patescibacteria group bacterium]
MQIGKKIARLKRRYARVTAYKFFYNRDADLRRREPEINCWILIHSNAYGYSLIEDLKFTYQSGRTALEWSAALDPKQGWVGKKDGERWSLFRVFIEKILPSINKNKAPHEQWRFHSFVGFAYDLRKRKDSPVSERAKTQSPRRAKSGYGARV